MRESHVHSKIAKNILVLYVFLYSSNCNITKKKPM